MRHERASIRNIENRCEGDFQAMAVNKHMDGCHIVTGYKNNLMIKNIRAFNNMGSLILENTRHLFLGFYFRTIVDGRNRLFFSNDFSESHSAWIQYALKRPNNQINYTNSGPKIKIQIHLNTN